MKRVAEQTRVREETVVCIDCESRIALHGAIKLGQEIVCPHCDAELEVIDTDPVELDWIYEEDLDEDEDEDEDW